MGRLIQEVRCWGDEAETAVGKRRESAVRLMTSVDATLCGWSFCCRFPTNVFDRLPEKAASQHRPAGRWPSCVRVLHGLQLPAFAAYGCCLLSGRSTALATRQRTAPH